MPNNSVIEKPPRAHLDGGFLFVAELAIHPETYLFQSGIHPFIAKQKSVELLDAFLKLYQVGPSTISSP